MCGIAGFSGKGSEQVLQTMVTALKHRGPDDQGIFFDGAIGLAHTRLSIIDLSPTGHQPMASVDGKVHIVFNGEIYNYRELKQGLGSYRFRSSSDTEVILALYQQHGTKVFDKLSGMFSLALYDENTGSLILARDRIGKKPLYYSIIGETLVFGSEPKALLAHPSIVKKLNMQALGLYLQHEYVPTPLSIFENMHKLEPGTYAVWRDRKFTRHAFWRPRFDEQQIDFESAVHAFDRHLDRSVSSRLISEVPLGIFLSGGIDSSTIAYYAQKYSSQKIKTFSIGFDETSFDESKYARLVANHLGTEHYEEQLKASDALDLIPHIADLLDEPMADPSIVPTYLLSRFTRKQVTVALGGDGGDELLAGYDTFRALKASIAYEKMPALLRQGLLEPLLKRLPETEKYMSLGFVAKRFIRNMALPIRERVQGWMSAFDERSLRSLLLDPSAVTSVPLPLDDTIVSHDPYQQLIYQYLRTYLIDDILVKVDRASMYQALEVRAPFLDYELIDFVNRLPSSYKLHRMTTKYLLKRLMVDKLPAAILHRKKKGFGIPLTRWLKKDLRPLVEDLLSRDRIRKQGIFDPDSTTLLLEQHINGKQDHRKELWTLAVFQMWYDRWYK